MEETSRAARKTERVQEWRSLNRPPPLRPGGAIGVVSPSSPVETARFERGLGRLRAAGFQVVLGEHAYARRGHHAGTPDERAADLNSMFARDDVDAIVCARGGSSSIRMLDRLDYESIAGRPKVFVGYSDVTSLQLALLARSGLPTFFGPMVQPEFGGEASGGGLEALLRLAGEPQAAGELRDARLPGCARALRGGVAEGPGVGGTLTLIAAATGTPYCPDFGGSILFFEDVGESPARVERCLSQLGAAGILGQAAGFLVGDCRWEAKDDDRNRYLTAEEVYEDLLGPLGKPLLCGFPFGHLPDPLTIPQGIRLRLDADRKSVTVLEPAVDAERSSGRTV